MKKCVFLLFALIVVFVLSAEEIFPGVYGEDLVDSLVKYYKCSYNLGYDAARDTMYGKIDKVGDSLSCVYTHYTIYMNPYADPSSDAYSKGINCEHTWPQSLGADVGLPEGDMHHLYPSEIGVNSARGSLPFGEIDDSQTDMWFRDDDTLYSIPTSNIDEYSELLKNVKFEPREDHKGRVARSMYYFYTMYRDEYLAEDSDTSWWKSQRDILYEWHELHPPDSAEIARTYKIAEYQDGKVNPFVIDTSLITRCYYPELYVEKNGDPDIYVINNSIKSDSPFYYRIYDIVGRFVEEGSTNNLILSNDYMGIYFVYVKLNDKTGIYKLIGIR